MATSAASIFFLRKRTKHLDNTGIYKMKLYPFMPLIFIITYAFVGTMIAITTPQYAIIGTSVLVIFMILYFLTKIKTKKKTNILRNL
jgi:APA family basic amino acid/polyamine antiporter